MAAPAYKYGGQTDGVAWKSKPRRFCIGTCNSLLDIHKWAEQHDEQKITDEMFEAVVGHFMTPRQHAELQGAIWTFLGGCLSGSAETMWKKADPLCGLDAWR